MHTGWSLTPWQEASVKNSFMSSFTALDPEDDAQLGLLIKKAIIQCVASSARKMTWLMDIS
jgi:hypothetical protein